MNSIEKFIKKKSILKIKQKFKSGRHNVEMIWNDDKVMQSIDSIETYAYETGKDLVSDKEKIKCNNMIKLNDWYTKYNELND